MKIPKIDVRYVNHSTRTSVAHVRLMALLILATLFVIFPGCGGGTDGTGLKSRTIQGQVDLTDSSPLAGAEITLIENGTMTITGENGEFSLIPPGDFQILTFRIRKDLVDATATLANVPDSSEPVSVTITVNASENTAEARLIDLTSIDQFEIRASIIGACDPYFDNERDSINQRDEITNGTTCNLRAQVRGDGELTGGVKVAIQRRPCDGREPWVTTALGITSTRLREGTTIIPFRFFTTERGCRYRVIAPFSDRPDDRVASFKIHTLLESRSAN